MTILLHTQSAESFHLSRGWLGGGGWRWLQSHEPPLETTNHFHFFRNNAATTELRVSATTATTTTATPSMQREVK